MTPNASCADPPTPAPIDVGALSQGQPDGVYYAGKRLLPWLTFEERIELGRHAYGSGSMPRGLLEQAQGESLVLVWEVSGGRASAAREFPRPTLERRGRMEPGTPVSFIWGKVVRHVAVYELGHQLLQHAIWGKQRFYEGSTNDHIDWFMPVLNAFGDEWVIPAIDIRRRAALEDLRRALKRSDNALADVVALGIAAERVEYELADHIDRCKP